MPDEAGQPPSRNSCEPLGIPFIEPFPKRVVLADDFTNIPLNTEQEADFLAIRAAITRGGSLQPYYRASTTYDRLLRAHQVLHLHLGGKNSDAILYLVQYPEHVLFVCVGTHKHLRSTPPGSQLAVLGRDALRRRCGPTRPPGRPGCWQQRQGCSNGQSALTSTKLSPSGPC